MEELLSDSGQIPQGAIYRPENQTPQTVIDIALGIRAWRDTQRLGIGDLARMEVSPLTEGDRLPNEKGAGSAPMGFRSAADFALLRYRLTDSDLAGSSVEYLSQDFEKG